MQAPPSQESVSDGCAPRSAKEVHSKDAQMTFGILSEERSVRTDTAAPKSMHCDKRNIDTSQIGMISRSGTAHGGQELSYDKKKGYVQSE